MTSPPPLAFDTYYHVYNRGTNGENLFKAEENYPYFLKQYAKYIYPVAETFAYCLLPNHFHVLIRTRTPEEQEAIYKETPKETLKVFKTFRVLSPSQQFSNLFNAYSKAINKRYGRTGGLFEHPFRRIAVMDEAYFTALVIYIHQNPQRHGLLDDFRDWAHSSYHTLLSLHPTKLYRERVVNWFIDQQHLQTRHQGPVNEIPIAPLILDDFD